MRWCVSRAAWVLLGRLRDIVERSDRGQTGVDEPLSDLDLPRSIVLGVLGPDPGNDAARELIHHVGASTDHHRVRGIDACQLCCSSQYVVCCLQRSHHAADGVRSQVT